MCGYRKIYITPYKQFWLTAIYENEKLAEVYADYPDSAGLLNRIYIGKVKSVVKNIGAAFIEIAGGVEGYYKMSENPYPFFTNQKKNSKFVPGDEILVQVEKENIKTKAPVLTSCISLAGRYSVLKAGKEKAAVSGKIKDEQRRQELVKIAEENGGEDFCFIIRTKAEKAQDTDILEDIRSLKEKYSAILSKSRYLTCFSEVYKAPEEYISRIEQMNDEALIKVSTDIRTVYEKLRDCADFGSKLVFYEDEQLPLIKLLSLETQLERALKPQVWLKSGGSLIIEPTEAFVVIDVNTGRYDGKKTGEDTFLKINLEAAEEIARQLRLRNLSGIILIDFINMKKAENKKLLIDTLKASIEKDSVKTVFVDMTRLNIVELTRKKVRKPLFEQLKETQRKFGR